jgi:uncharacterized protein
MRVRPIISADSHVFEPADLWGTRLDKKFRQCAPEVIVEDGRLFLTAPGGIKAIVSPFSAVGKKGAELQEHMAGGFDTVRRGGWDPLVRLKDQDTDGVAAEILYTSHAMALFGLQDAELQMACFRAFNEWLAEFCSASPRRLLGIGLISVTDPRAGVAELERCIKIGLTSGMISNDPVTPYDDHVYDPLWRAACELNVPLSMHSITGGKPRDMTGGVFKTAPMLDFIHDSQRTFAIMLQSDLFERFPKLRVVSVENDIGWIPYFLHMLDKNYEIGFSRQGAPRKPSEYAREHLWATFQDDPNGVALWKNFGENNFMWASDFPHVTSTWPNSRQVIDENFSSVPEKVKNKIVFENVKRLYQIELERAFIADTVVSH